MSEFKLKIFKCCHCQGLFVIMLTERNKLLPVNVIKGEIVDADETFNSSKRRSHLLDCKERGNDWDQIKKKYQKNDALRLSYQF